MIRFNKIHKTYPRQIGETQAYHALKGINLHLKKGQTLGLIGQNGAGKSTSIRLMLDFIRPDSGDIQLLGHSPQQPSLRKNIGYLPETPSFPDNLNCMEMLRFAGQCCAMSKKQVQERAEILLTQLNIWDDRNHLIRSYSKGMKQRASFAVALLHNPDLIILDEPMSGLDPMGRNDIINLIGDLQDDGKSILFCSHLLDDIERITNNIAILHQGSLLFSGNSLELRKHRPEWVATMFHGEQQTLTTKSALSQFLRDNADNVQHVQQQCESLQDSFIRVVTGVK